MHGALGALFLSLSFAATAGKAKGSLKGQSMNEMHVVSRRFLASWTLRKPG